jgi:hypothetical protein
MKTFISQFATPTGPKWLTFFAPDASFAREHADHVAFTESFTVSMVAQVPTSRVQPHLMGYFKPSQQALLH